jgi:histidyl-tRNA synthetase
LIEYFLPLSDRLSEDSRRRLRVNPLRVLDDKDLDPDIAAAAPRAANFLCDACRAHFQAVRDQLDALGVRYAIDHRLVRGLDYYTRTTVEFFVEGHEGQQDALGGGGRYDGLVALLGGQAAPAIGFGLGIDRTVMAALQEGVATAPPEQLIAVLSADPEAYARRLELATKLRAGGLRVRVDGLSRKLGKQLEAAAKAEARFAVIAGEAADTVTLRDLASGEQRDLALDDIPDAIRA